MRKHLLGILSVALCSTSILANAATMITVINNTDNYGTGYAKIPLCSSVVPKGEGIIQPHSNKSFDIAPLKAICQEKDCDAHVFLSKNCTGKQLAKVVVNSKKGIVSFTNYDKAHYNIVLTDNVIIIDAA